MDLTNEEMNFYCWQEREIYLLFKPSRPVLQPTQQLRGQHRGLFSLGIYRTGCECDHSSPSSTQDKNEWSHTFSPYMQINSYFLEI